MLIRVEQGKVARSPRHAVAATARTLTHLVAGGVAGRASRFASVPDGNDLFNGGPGSETVSYANAPTGLFAGLEDANANTGAALGDSYVLGESLIGAALSDTLYGTGSVNSLSGGGGNDTMVGNRRRRYLHGGAGSDTVAYDANFALLRADLLSPGTGTGVEGASYRSACLVSLNGCAVRRTTCQYRTKLLLKP